MMESNDKLEPIGQAGNHVGLLQAPSLQLQ